MRVLDLFSGIGGGACGIIAADLHHVFEPTAFVEWNHYCKGVLNKWFPTVPVHCDDIRNFHAVPGQFDIVMCSPNCQPHSLAGSQKGELDERDMWPEVYRILKETEPIGFIIENVPGIRHSNKGQFLRNILSDITSAGYEYEWQTLSVRALGGIHKRQRFFLIAYPQGQRWAHFQSAIATEKRTDSSPSTPDNSTSTGWTSVISEAKSSSHGLSAFLAGCLMTHDDLPEALANSTIKATAEEVREALQAVGNSIAPLQIAKVWQKLYEKLF